MSVRNFMCHQRYQLIRLIYETFFEKHQRSTQTLLVIEELYRKNLSHPEDDSIDNSLRQLKAMLQFSNHDILTQIDMALEQTAISKTFIEQKPQSSSKREENYNHKNVIVIDEDRKRRAPSYYNQDNVVQDQWDNVSDHYEEEDQERTEKKRGRNQCQNEMANDLGITNSQFAMIQSRLRQVSQNVKEEANLIKLEDNTESVQKLESTSHLSLSEDQDDQEEEEISQPNIHKERKYQEYIQQIFELEEKYGLKPTPNFVDKEFFFLRIQSKRSRIKPLLKAVDKEYIEKLVGVLDVKQDVARILRLSRNLINASINSKKNGQFMDNDEKDKEIIKADKSLISTTKKRGRPKKEKHY